MCIIYLSNSTGMFRHNRKRAYVCISINIFRQHPLSKVPGSVLFLPASNHTSNGVISSTTFRGVFVLLRQITTTASATLDAGWLYLITFYIKPQLFFGVSRIPFVVSYSLSTSNHNNWATLEKFDTVVSYSLSTSNHNPLFEGVIAN